jgi:HEAT repeat protein
MTFRMGLIFVMAALCIVPSAERSIVQAQGGKVSWALLEKLGSADPDERDAAVADVLKIGKDAAPALVEELGKGTVRSRCSALLCLEKLEDFKTAKSVEFFLKSAATMDELLYAIKALGVLGNASTKQAVKPMLEYKAPSRLDEKEVGWIAEKSRETEEGFVRNQAAETLARLGDFTGVPVLIDGLDSNGWVRRDAHIRLMRMTGCKVDFGYNLGSSRKERAAAIAKWKKWWGDSKSRFKPEWTNSHKVFDVNKRGG